MDPEKRKELEKLADLGVLPSSLGIGETGDTSMPYMALSKWDDLDGDFTITDDGVDENDENTIEFLKRINPG